MPDFLAQYLAVLSARRDSFLHLFEEAPANEAESALCTALAAEWHPYLPPPAPDPRAAYAVDGSDAIRGFDNGTFLIVSHALLAGPEMEATDTDVVLQRDTLSPDSRERLRGLLTRALEIGLALREVERCANGVLYLDGSIYAQLVHLIYPYEAAAHAALPLLVLERYLDLIDACRQHHVTLVALSKTTRGHLLAHALLPDPEVTRPSYRGRDDVDSPNDGEVLARWTRGIGQTSPVLVGWEAFGNRAAQVVNAPSDLVQAFDRMGVGKERAAETLKRLRRMPAVWAAYVRLDLDDNYLRVECLSDTVMPDAPAIVDLNLQVMPPNLGCEVLAQVVADHASPRLYNTGLYVVDRLVRLPRAVVDEKYLPLLREALGLPLRLNRSERRFHKF